MEHMVTYFITVENTGQTNQSIDLILEEVTDSGCNNPQDLTVTLSDSQVALDVEETEQITVEVEVPEGQQANDYCWELTGTVSGSNPAQNATDTQIKMFLTRIGENSKIVINGDPSQIDLPNKSYSGLVRSKKILGHIKEISTIDFDHLDVVRHPLVSKIVKAYSDDFKRNE